MFGKLGDMMGKLQEMKKKADEIKLKLDNTMINCEAAGGDIKITISGGRKIKSINIAPALQHGSPLELQEQLVLAFNKAIEKADKVNEEEMKNAASGLLPGLT
jgi:DNA-binding YbaB/EbfC family protein